MAAPQDGSRALATNNAAWLVGEKLVQFATGIFVGAYVARYLGVSDFGVLTYASAFSFLLYPLATVTQPLVVRDLVLHPERERELLGSAAVVSGATLAGSALLTITAAAAGGGETFHRSVPLLLLLAVGFVVRPLQVVDFVFQAQTRSRPATIARTSSMLSIAAVRLLLASFGAPLWTFAAAVTADAFLSTFLLLWMYHRTGSSLRWKWSPSAIRHLGRTSAPLLLANLAVVVYLRVDQIMLGAISNSSETGAYSVAVALSEATYFIPVALAVSVTPYMTRLHKSANADFYARLQALFTLLTALSYVLALAAVLLVSPAVSRLYGPSFEGAVKPFTILMLALPAVFLGVAQNIWNTLEGQLVLSLTRTVAGAVANVGLNLVLLPRYGAVGAACTTVVANYIASILGNAASRRTRGILVMQIRALFLMDLRSAATFVRSRTAT